MGNYVVRSHQLALVDDALDGQKPHRTYVAGDVVELDDDNPHTGTLVMTGAVQSQKAAEKAADAEESSRQLESDVGRHEAKDEAETTTTTTTTTTTGQSEGKTSTSDNGPQQGRTAKG